MRYVRGARRTGDNDIFTGTAASLLDRRADKNKKGRLLKKEMTGGKRVNDKSCDEAASSSSTSQNKKHPSLGL